jgi:hypothetical protein
MCVAYKTFFTRRAVVVSWMIQPSDTGVSRHHSPIEADDRRLRAPPCQLVDRPPGTRQVAEPRGAHFPIAVRPAR